MEVLWDNRHQPHTSLPWKLQCCHELNMTNALLVFHSGCFNLTQQQEMKQQLEAFFVNQLNEFKATAFHEILKCRNEITDLRNELGAVEKEKLEKEQRRHRPLI